MVVDLPINHATPEQLTEDQKNVENNPSITHLFRAPNGHKMMFLNSGLGFGGMWLNVYSYPKDRKEILPRNKDTIRGFGTSRRCPNQNRICQHWLNFNKFLKCFNRFEHLGYENAVSKCDFLIRQCHPSWLKNWNERRADNLWPGIESNYMPKDDEEDDDDDW